MSAKKQLQIIAGPNGSGKSTFAESFILPSNPEPIFINSDTIASGISPKNVDLAQFQAGRIMLESIKAHLHLKKSFSFETTLSGKSWVHLINEAIHHDYEIDIHFLYLDKVQQNLKRISERRSLGGHDVPKATVIRRYPKTFNNFWNLYRPLCTRWFIYNNSGSKPKLEMSHTRFNKLSPTTQNTYSMSFLKRGLFV